MVDLNNYLNADVGHEIDYSWSNQTNVITDNRYTLGSTISGIDSGWSTYSPVLEPMLNREDIRAIVLSVLRELGIINEDLEYIQRPGVQISEKRFMEFVEDGV